MSKYVCMGKTIQWFELNEDKLATATANVIKRYRAQRGLSRDRLAFEIHLHKHTLYGVEVGVKRKSGRFSKTQLTLSNFIKISSFFQVPPGDFLQEVLDEYAK